MLDRFYQQVDLPLPVLESADLWPVYPFARCRCLVEISDSKENRTNERKRKKLRTGKQNSSITQVVTIESVDEWWVG
jgi:hypothetical protein